MNLNIVINILSCFDMNIEYNARYFIDEIILHRASVGFVISFILEMWKKYVYVPIEILVHLYQYDNSLYHQTIKVGIELHTHIFINMLMCNANRETDSFIINIIKYEWPEFFIFNDHFNLSDGSRMLFIDMPENLKKICINPLNKTKTDFINKFLPKILRHIIVSKQSYIKNMI